MKILILGNSFGCDAAYYLHDILAGANMDVKVVNLYIGGCSLERHYENIDRHVTKYQYQVNKMQTERYVDLDEVLEEEFFDYVVTQQASHDSGWINTYEPFMGLIIEHIKKKSPKTKIILQKTWAYDVNSTHPAFIRYNCSQDEMYKRLTECYEEISNKYSLPLILCADVIQRLRKEELFSNVNLTRDGFHMSFIYGRYALGCIWARSLFGIELKNNSFVPQIDFMKAETSIELVKKIQEIVDEFSPLF